MGKLIPHASAKALPLGADIVATVHCVDRRATFSAAFSLLAKKAFGEKAFVNLQGILSCRGTFPSRTRISGCFCRFCRWQGDRLGKRRAAIDRTLVEANEAREGLAELGARDDRVYKTVLHQVFGRLEVFRQFLADGLLDDAAAGEANSGLGFGENDIAEHGKAGGDASGGGVGENGDIEQAAIAMSL